MSSAPSGGARWAALAAITVAALVLAVVASVLGYLFRGDFASGGSSPAVAAVFWAVGAVLVAVPVAVLPWLGFRVRPAVALGCAAAVAVLWFVGGFVVLA